MSNIFSSYNTGSRVDLGAVGQLIDMYNPDIVLLQEVKVNADQIKALIGRVWAAEVDPGRPGVAVV